MKKKLLVGVLLVSVMALLTGCHMSHEWQDATCTTPRTCLTGGETEGEALGHTWIDATCSEPKHCSVCGETEGEPLAHTWVDATCSEPKHCSVCGETEGEALAHTWIATNYQQPATCEVCGETEGEPLQAYFEKYGLVCNAELDTAYPFVIPCYDPSDYTTEGKVTYSDYEIFESDDTHEALEGYEWRAITITITFDDENAYNYGFSGFATLIEDYYTDVFDKSDGDKYTLNYYGTDYTDVQYDSVYLQGGWNDDIYTYKTRNFVRVPKGYDSIAFAVVRYNSSTWDNDAPITDHIGDDTVFFRLK